MRVLVAGAAGFIGSWTVEALLKKGHDVVALDNFLSGCQNNLAAVYGDINFIEADIRDRDAIHNIIDQAVDAVVHLAFPTPLCCRGLGNQFYDVAAVGTANLLELALRSEAYFLYGSSISVYGEQKYVPIDEEHPTAPILIYGTNKLLGEQLCGVFSRIYGLRWGALRISDTYGPRDRRSNAINNFLTAARDGSLIQIAGSGEQRRSYTYVSNVANAIVEVIQKPLGNTIVNVATDEAASINELARLIQTDLAFDTKIIYDPTASDSRDYVFSNLKYGRHIGDFHWTPLREGLELTYYYEA